MPLYEAKKPLKAFRIIDWNVIRKRENSPQSLPLQTSIMTVPGILVTLQNNPKIFFHDEKPLRILKQSLVYAQQIASNDSKTQIQQQNVAHLLCRVALEMRQFSNTLVWKVAAGCRILSARRRRINLASSRRRWRPLVASTRSVP